jgi:hypothetical protein
VPEIGLEENKLEYEDDLFVLRGSIGRSSMKVNREEFYHHLLARNEVAFSEEEEVYGSSGNDDSNADDIELDIL